MVLPTVGGELSFNCLTILFTLDLLHLLFLVPPFLHATASPVTAACSHLTGVHLRQAALRASTSSHPLSPRCSSLSSPFPSRRQLCHRRPVRSSQAAALRHDLDDEEEAEAGQRTRAPAPLRPSRLRLLQDGSSVSDLPTCRCSCLCSASDSLMRGEIGMWPKFFGDSCSRMEGTDGSEGCCAGTK